MATVRKKKQSSNSADTVVRARKRAAAKPAKKVRGPSWTDVVRAHALVAACPNPAAALHEIQTGLVVGTVPMIAREGLYRQSTGVLMRFTEPLIIDARIWGRIEKDAQIIPLWTTAAAKLTAATGTAMDLINIQVGSAALQKILRRMGTLAKPSMRGKPVIRHGDAIDFLMRYLRAMDEPDFRKLKAETVQQMLDKCYMATGGKSLGARGLKDLTAEIRGLVEKPRVHPELAANLAQIAGITKIPG